MRRTRVSLAASLTILLALSGNPLVPAESINDLRYQAFQLYEQGRFREAIPLLDQVIARHHRDIQALIKRGNCYCRLDQPKRAIPDFEQAIHYNPFHPGGYTDLGIALLMLGRNEEARAMFTQAIRVWNGPASTIERFLDVAASPGGGSLPMFPVLNTAGSLSKKKSLQIIQGHATAHSGLGQAYHRLGEDERAIAEYNQAIKIYPDDPNAFIGRGDCCLSLGEPDRALDNYNEAIRLGPNYSRAYARRGKLLETKGEWDKAQADYDKAIQLDPNFTYAFRLRAGLLSRRGQNAKAFADAELAGRLSPQDAGAFKDRGGILVRMGHYQQAIDELNKAVELDPNLATAYLNRGAAYNSLGQYERAIKDLEKALELDPQSAPAHTNIGLAYFMIGQYDRAALDLSEAVRLAPKSAVVHFNRANVYARLGLKEQAIVDYEAAGRLHPQLIAHYGGTAKLLEEIGRQNLAVRDEKRIDLHPDPKELNGRLEQGNLLRYRGDWRGAILEYNRVLELDPGRVDVYVARGWSKLCAGDAGAEADARAYLSRKGWRDRLSLYMAILGYFGAIQSGKESQASIFLDEAIATTIHETWPSPLVRYLRHDMNTDALLKRASSQTEQTEAHTFAALEWLRRGDRKKAREHLNWVRDHGAAKSIATDLARATLERLDHPPSGIERITGVRPSG
ncbi:MAG: tetratricopeptide repeat protein [Isosphaeraceae bacterium]